MSGSLIAGVRWLAAFAGRLYCPREKCGNRVLPQDRFCGRCGMKLNRWVVCRMYTNGQAYADRLLDNADARLQLEFFQVYDCAAGHGVRR